VKQAQSVMVINTAARGVGGYSRCACFCC